MGFSVMLGGAEKLVPAEYWCPYGTLYTCGPDDPVSPRGPKGPEGP